VLSSDFGRREALPPSRLSLLSPLPAASRRSRLTALPLLLRLVLLCVFRVLTSKTALSPLLLSLLRGVVSPSSKEVTSALQLPLLMAAVAPVLV
jgi:hypothetical protein